MRLTATILAALLLGGCSTWVGPSFYAAGEAVNPFSPGLYQLRGGRHGRQLARWDGHHLSSSGRGAEEIETQLKEWRAIPLRASADDTYVLQIDNWGKDGRAIYGVLQKRGPRYRASLPNCEATAALARAAGATLDQPNTGEGQSTVVDCVFPTRESLETALRRYIVEREMLGVDIERIGN